jgi:hypothetical protein
MPHLDPSELNCLTHIAHGETPTARACTEVVLGRLLALGLIESNPTCCLPLEMPTHGLRLTPAGRAALEPR